jgi:hypothetical protein
VDIPGATGSSYVITPGDVAATISVVVTATGAGGSQPATAAPTVQVVPAPVPAAVPGSLAAAAGVAGAVVTSDARATVTWQPGAVPVGTVVSLTPASVAAAVRASAVALDFSPAQTMLPWPVDIAYAAASPSDVAGFSRDGKTWLPIPALTAPVLTGTLLEGTYVTGSVVHVLTREPGRIAFFHAGRWGDPRRISAHAPVLRRLTPLRVVRRRDGTLLVTTRFSTSSQAHLYAAPLTARTTILAHGSRLAGGTSRQALVLRSGGFPIRWRIATHASVVRIRLGATDPWGRRGGFTISFRVP